MWCLLLASAAGCNGGVAQELAGAWIGKPESFAERNQRESSRYAAQLGIDAPVAASATVASSDAAPSPREVEGDVKTDWERFDIIVGLNFTGDNAIEMSLGEGSQPVAGRWRIVEKTPARIVIEITTPSMPAGDETDATEVHRRFELQPDRRDGALIGFTLSEVGADRQVGWLYFTRPAAE